MACSLTGGGGNPQPKSATLTPSPTAGLATASPTPQPWPTPLLLATYTPTSPTPPACWVTAGFLHLRSCASVACPVLDILAGGDLVKIAGSDPGGWLLLADPQGWVNPDFLECKP